jgi:hypothetical protein
MLRLRSPTFSTQSKGIYKVAESKWILFTLEHSEFDPKTAEIISKILLLAKDKEIKDPTILQQIL